MKTRYNYIAIITVLLGLSCLCYFTFIRIKDRKSAEKQIQTLLPFKLHDIFFNPFNSSNFTINNSCLIIYFHPDCEHCQYEAEQISLNIDLFNNFQIILISTASRESVYEFAYKYHLFEFDNITLLVDTLDVFHNTFGPNPFPTSFIYNKERKLVMQFKGEVTTTNLLKYLNQ